MISKVQWLMDTKNINSEELSRLAGVSRGEISKSKHHIEFCSVMTLMAIANALVCKVKDLFEEEE